MTGILKILHIISSTGTGGAELSLFRLVDSIDRSHFSNVVVSMKSRGETASLIENSGCQFYSLDMKRGKPDVKSIFKLRKIIKEFNPDIIQCWMYHANMMGLLMGGKSIIFWNIRCSDMDLAKYGFVYKWTVKANARFSGIPLCVIVNSFVGKKFHEDLGFRPKRWEVIQNGFDIVVFKPDPDERISVRRELCIPEKAITVGLIARFDPMKDHGTFLNATNMLIKMYPDVHLVLAGTNITNENPELWKYIKNKKDNYHLLGERHDIFRIMTALDISSSSSSYGEGFPNVVGESMACGVPCVVTDVGDSKYLVGDTGVVVPKQNPEALFEGIRKLIDAGPEYRAKQGGAARKRIIENFSLEKCVKRYESLYREYVN